ncbi:MAG: hypothetical protein KatS3mg102_1187 [Planctomycetota bacterium]|nr:MAG: hypothetical protein KatS3mg102_1187 [Planctomycetota bacterium]
MAEGGRYFITYTGSGVAELKGAGLFQTNTSAFVDAEIAELARQHGNFKVEEREPGVPEPAPVAAATEATKPAPGGGGAAAGAGSFASSMPSPFAAPPPPADAPEHKKAGGEAKDANKQGEAAQPAAQADKGKESDKD